MTIKMPTTNNKLIISKATDSCSCSPPSKKTPSRTWPRPPPLTVVPATPLPLHPSPPPPPPSSQKPKQLKNHLLPLKSRVGPPQRRRGSPRGAIYAAIRSDTATNPLPPLCLLPTPPPPTITAICCVKGTGRRNLSVFKLRLSSSAHPSAATQLEFHRRCDAERPSGRGQTASAPDDCGAFLSPLSLTPPPPSESLIYIFRIIRRSRDVQGRNPLIYSTGLALQRLGELLHLPVSRGRTPSISPPPRLPPPPAVTG